MQDQRLAELEARNRTLDKALRRLETRNRRLEAVVEERTLQVDRLLAQQSTLVKHLGHDLKTPLTPVVAMLPLVRGAVEEAETAEMLDVVIDSVGYIHALVDQALELADLPQMEPVTEPVDVCHLIDDLLASHGDRYAVENRLPAGLAVVGDRLMIRKVLAHVLDNAVGFTAEGGSIEVTGGESGRRVEIVITDSGIGMTEEQIRRAFDEFYKADPARNRLGSTGLGLTICRRMLGNLGGTISMASSGLGHGTSVTIGLPVAEDGNGD